MSQRDTDQFRQEFVDFLHTGMIIDFNLSEIVRTLCDYVGGNDLRHLKYIHREHSFQLNDIEVLTLNVNYTSQQISFTCPKFRYALRDPMSLSQPPLAIAKYIDSSLTLFMEGIVHYRTSSIKCFPEQGSRLTHAGWVSESIVQARPGSHNYDSYYSEDRRKHRA